MANKKKVTSPELQETKGETANTTAENVETTEVKVEETNTEEKTEELKTEESTTVQSPDEKVSDQVTNNETKEDTIETVISPELAETAKKLMKENDVKSVYRTKDGYWFTKSDLAKQHQDKVGGEVETFNEQ